MPVSASLSFDIATLREGFLTRSLTVEAVVELALDRIERETRAGIWIAVASRDAVMKSVAELRGRDPRDLPLYGIPFAVKDNIDVAGMPTTAACPAFAYTPAESAPVVQNLIDAGAICLGKTNMDQFAAGLVGTRSPYGACQNAFDPNFISGGSSSGSAVAVARGHVSFALGTDTAGSGRVPAAFNNLIGYKPTRGLFSIKGVVPACRSLDCVSIFSLTVEDAKAVESRAKLKLRPSRIAEPGEAVASPYVRICIPYPPQLKFFGDAGAEKLFNASLERIQSLGAKIVAVDYSPFREAAEMLYGGPFIAERYAGIRAFFDAHADTIFPITRKIIERGKTVSGADVFEDIALLDELRDDAAREWEKMDALLLPTTGTIYSITEVNAEPVELNSRLGYYTNFVNLLDCCALALPAGFREVGYDSDSIDPSLPFGITLIAPARRDAELFEIGARYHNALGGQLGATGKILNSPPSFANKTEGLNVMESKTVRLAVVGAHLRGQPLNHELTKLNAAYVETCNTAPVYKLYALATQPPKPGLIQVEPGEGTPIEVEIWELTAESFGLFVAHVPPPMAIGTLKLESGASVKGFLCEPLATKGAADISVHKGWKNYLNAKKS